MLNVTFHLFFSTKIKNSIKYYDNLNMNFIILSLMDLKKLYNNYFSMSTVKFVFLLFILAI